MISGIMAKYKQLQDLDLIVLLKEDDEAAFTEIYERYKWILYSHAYKKLKNREEARDVIQELFAGLWTKRNAINFNANLSGYLYTAMRNKILNIIAHQQVADKYVDSLEAYAAQDSFIADHLIREKQLAILIEQEIASLPPKMKALFLLSRKEYLSHREIACKMEISEETVKRQMKNALKTLRLKLGIFSFLLFF
jgi:RNA polymerase sigma-70 factor (family 1)